MKAQSKLHRQAVPAAEGGPGWKLDISGSAAG